MLRDSAILTISRFAFNALIAAGFGRICAKSRSAQSGFDPRTRCRFIRTSAALASAVGQLRN
jgi:ABC-type tungstate transport system substrate-binding protein